MAQFCLTKQAKEQFSKALRDREIDPAKLSSMTSEARRTFLEKYVGKENAVQTNALFESKLLLKNQKAGYINWAKKVSGISKEAKRDLISRIERLDKVLSPSEEQAFLKDLAETRLGFGVSEVEAKTISDLSIKMRELKAKVNPDGEFPSKTDRLNYGWANVQLEKYVNDLKLQTNKVSFKDQPLQAGLNLIKETPGALKSIVASLDNSFFGRQGIKTLLDIRTSHIWAKNFLKSWGDIGKELAGKDAMDAIKADIYSRPNALNGKYKAGKYGLDVLTEEAYPSSLPEKIPLLRRLFKASESAYNGGALRMRADLADRLIKLAEKQGVNTLDPREAEGLGSLISSLTGRGSLGKGEVLAKDINTVLFSVKFMKSNFDTLTAHLFDSKVRKNKFAREEAAKNLLSITASIGTVLMAAKILDPTSVDEDPRSSNFGKVKLFGQWTDITGGLAGLVTLASRTLVPTEHNGKISLWKKTGTGTYIDLLEGGYGQQNAWDLLFEGLVSNKLSPIAGIFRDRLKGETFQGEKPTLENQFGTATTPLIKQSFDKLMKDPNASSVLGSMILEGLGFSISSSSPKEKSWSTQPTKAQQGFLDKVGKDKFTKANDEYNTQYGDWFTKTSQSEQYKNLSDEAKQSLITKSKDEIQTKIFKKYGFKYKQSKKDKQQREESKSIKKLLPK